MEQFILPEKWHVIRTEENAKVLNEWSNKVHKCGAHCIGEGYIYSHRGHSNVLSDKSSEISFEQFKEYVLKEQFIPLIFN